MDTFDSKNVFKRLMINVEQIGVQRKDKLQASLQFHIWKFCIKQRLFDETLFVSLTGVLLYLLLGLMMMSQSKFNSLFLFAFEGEAVMGDFSLVSARETGQFFCVEAIRILNEVSTTRQLQAILIYFVTISLMTKVGQKAVVVSIKENVDLDPKVLCIEILTIAFGIIFVYK